MQLAAMLGLFALSASDPARDLRYVWAAVLFTGVCSATQDISMDAWRLEVAEADAQGVMAAAYAWGFRSAMIASGVIPLVLAQTARLACGLCGDGVADGHRPGPPPWRPRSRRPMRSRRPPRRRAGLASARTCGARWSSRSSTSSAGSAARAR